MRKAVKPTVVCLCGSTQFMAIFKQANMMETLAGKIVLSVGVNLKLDDLPDGLKKSIELSLLAGDILKARLDVLHLQKIDLADEILVLNVQTVDAPNGYIGDSTRREIAYAHQTGARVRFLNPPGKEYEFTGFDVPEDIGYGK